MYNLRRKRFTRKGSSVRGLTEADREYLRNRPKNTALQPIRNLAPKSAADILASLPGNSDSEEEEEQAPVPPPRKPVDLNVLARNLANKQQSRNRDRANQLAKQLEETVEFADRRMLRNAPQARMRTGGRPVVSNEAKQQETTRMLRSRMVKNAAPPLPQGPLDFDLDESVYSTAKLRKPTADKEGEDIPALVDSEEENSNDEAMEVDEGQRAITEIQDIISDMQSNHPTRILRGLKRVRTLFSKYNGVPPAALTLDESIWSTIMPRVIELSDPECPIIFRSAALAILYRYVKMFPEKLQILTGYGVLPILKNMLKRVIKYILDQPDEDCCNASDTYWISYTFWTVGGLGRSGGECRNKMFTEGFYDLLLKICEADFLNNKPTAITFVEQAVPALLDSCLAEPIPSFDQVKEAVEVCMMLIMNSDYSPYHELIRSACKAICVLGLGTSDTTTVKIEEFPEFVPSLIGLLSPERRRLSTVIAALKVVCKIGSESLEVKQHFLANGILQALKAVLEHPRQTKDWWRDENPILHNRSLKEACRVLATFTSDSVQLKAVIDAGIFPPLAKVMETEHAETKTAAAWVVCHALTNATEEQTMYIVTQKLLQPMSKIIAQHSQL